MKALEDLLLLLSKFLVDWGTSAAHLRAKAVLGGHTLKVSESLLTGLLYVLIINKSHVTGDFLSENIIREVILVVLQ